MAWPDGEKNQFKSISAPKAMESNVLYAGEGGIERDGVFIVTYASIICNNSIIFLCV
jgi:hypothetical protein